MSVVLDAPGVIGLRADGRPVYWARGAAEGDGAGSGSAPAPGADGGADSPDGGAGTASGGQGAASGGSGDGAEELAFNEENFNKLIAQVNASNAAIEAEREEWRQKLHRSSQDASKFRQQVRTLTGMVGEGATGKPGPKPAAGASGGESAVVAQADADSAVKAQLEAMRKSTLSANARAALVEAGVPKTAAAAAVRMIDLSALELSDSGEITGLDDQITGLREAVPQLFAPTASAGAATGTGAAPTARILRAAPPVSGKGAAGRGGEAPKEPTSADILAARLRGGGQPGS